MFLTILFQMKDGVWIGPGGFVLYGHHGAHRGLCPYKSLYSRVIESLLVSYRNWTYRIIATEFAYWAPNIESMGDSTKNVNIDSVSLLVGFFEEEDVRGVESNIDCMEKNLEDDTGVILGVLSAGVVKQHESVPPEKVDLGRPFSSSKTNEIVTKEIIKHMGSQVAYLLIYVWDDFISQLLVQALLQQIISPIETCSYGSLYTFSDTVDTESKLVPEEPDLAALKRILRYVQGTLDLGLHLYTSSTTSLVITYYLGPLNDITLFHALVPKLNTGVLLTLLHSPLSTATLVYCDNVSAVYMSANPVQHQRTKHIEIDIHFVRDMVTAGQVRVLHVPSRFQYADIFTKGLPSTLFEEFRSSLSVRPPPAPTVGAY
ncbi:ribonuclease H-like domain-containing protein [Tanacetum coccineum]